MAVLEVFIDHENNKSKRQEEYFRIFFRSHGDQDQAQCRHADILCKHYYYSKIQEYLVVAELDPPSPAGCGHVWAVHRNLGGLVLKEQNVGTPTISQGEEHR